MQKRTTTRTEPHTTIIATSNELVAMNAAITHYRKWISSTPQSEYVHRETIALLDQFQRRLTYLPAPQEASHEQQ